MRCDAYLSNCPNTRAQTLPQQHHEPCVRCRTTFAANRKEPRHVQYSPAHVPPGSGTGLVTRDDGGAGARLTFLSTTSMTTHWITGHFPPATHQSDAKRDTDEVGQSLPTHNLVMTTPRVRSEDKRGKVDYVVSDYPSRQRYKLP